MKQFKDPIYGYINIPKDVVSTIIDTPEFQRLRYIKQTSYLPVYAAALHNRFIHSLGVYYLGIKACNAIFKNSKNIVDECNFDMDIKSIFQLACLLHDVGHAPFSHSGEGFYIDVDKTIYRDLVDAVNNESFSSDIAYYHEFGKTAAPHEIMSVIVALNRFSSFFANDQERDFFARCITGYKYRDSEQNSSHAVLNAFISLLNSTTIDVDRLDYLIRDAYVMGYNSISIDYNRLLDNVLLVKTQHSVDHTPIQLAYKKSALSVIENVIYAHDSEKKWIQNHPVIQYEVFLIRQLLASAKSYYKKMAQDDLFSYPTLIPQDFTQTNENPTLSKVKQDLQDLLNDVKDEIILKKLKQIETCIKQLSINKISLLCDDDIIHLSKMVNSPFSQELFNRGIRRHPIWKSESEYKIYVDGFIGNESYDELQSQIKFLTKFLAEEAPSRSINKSTIEYCQTCLSTVDKSDLSDSDKENMRDRYNLLLKWFKAFEELADELKLKDFDFVIVVADNFESSFRKDDLAKTPIFFPASGKTYPLSKLISLFSVKETDRRKFFYVYFKRNNDEQIDALAVGKKIAKIILE